MRKIVLAAVLVLMASGAQASSYHKKDFGIIDPILYTAAAGGGYHPYGGPNLDIGVDASGASLAFADLRRAWMEGVDLSGADLRGADLSGGTWFSLADLSGTDFRGADLSYADMLGYSEGSPYYDAQTNFSGALFDEVGPLFDPVAAGWNLVPEPNTALLVGIGLVGMAARRRV